MFSPVKKSEIRLSSGGHNLSTSHNNEIRHARQMLLNHPFNPRFRISGVARPQLRVRLNWTHCLEDRNAVARPDWLVELFDNANNILSSINLECLFLIVILVISGDRRGEIQWIPQPSEPALTSRSKQICPLVVFLTPGPA
jgi:hypothetical protein